MDLDEFKVLLTSKASFPGQPDFAARQEGYPNAQARTSAEAKDRELDLVEEELENDREAPPLAPGTPPPAPARSAPKPKA